MDTFKLEGRMGMMSPSVGEEELLGVEKLKGGEVTWVPLASVHRTVPV